jgi:beta-glucosidase/6-phospho-beta-glucosidase/beta-galactosidase
VVPWGFRKQLNWIAQEYNNPPVLVTESGYSDRPDEGLNDFGRIYYYTVRGIELAAATPSLDSV